MLIISFRKYCGGSKHFVATINHKEIRAWVDDKSGKPAMVKGGSNGAIQIDFFNNNGGRQLKEISWQEWFKIFEEHALAFEYNKHNSAAKNESYRLIKRST